VAAPALEQLATDLAGTLRIVKVFRNPAPPATPTWSENKSESPCTEAGEVYVEFVGFPTS
jgi:hypothetical protein